MRRFTRFLTVGALIALQFGAVSPPAGAYGSSLGAFEIDGNLADDSGPGDPIDWSTPPPGVTSFGPNSTPPELSGSNKDDGFTNGSHEDLPSQWTCANAKAPGKDDIVSGQIAFRRVGTDQFAYVNYFRKETSGDAHVDYEFNHGTAPVNASCPSVAKRSVNDVLIAFDTEMGGKIINVHIYTWDGTQFVDSTGSGNADGGVNIPPAGKTISGHTNGDFGEAVINLTKTIGEVSCGEFSGAYMKTRSSTSLSASLQDRTARLPINPDNCPNSSLAKAVRNVNASPSTFATTATAKPGDTLEYRLTYSNAGPGTANNVVVTDAIAQNQSYVAGSCVTVPATSPNQCGVSGSNVTWSLGDVPPTGTSPKVLVFRVTLASVFPAGTTDVKNVGVYSTTQEGGSHNSNETTTTVTAAPKDVITKGALNVTKGGTTYASSVDAAPGDVIEYQLTYDNQGDANATNVVLSDPVPLHSTYVANSCTAPCSVATVNGVTTISWAVGTVAPSDPLVVRTFRVTLDGTVPTQGTTLDVTNVARVCTAQNSPACKDSTTVTVHVKTPNVSLDKAVRNVTTSTSFANSTNASPGNTLEYRLVATNNGTADATNVRVADVIQNLQTYVANSCVPSTCTVSGSSISWPGVTLAANGGTATYTFQVTLASTFPNGTTSVKDTATVVSNEEPSKNSDETTTTVVAAPVDRPGKLARNATSNPTGTFTSTVTANPGDSIEYQLSYQNTGNAVATNVVLSDPIPPHSTFVSCSNTCTQTKNAQNVVTDVSWNIGDVAPNLAAITRTFIVKLDTTGFTAGSSTPVQNVAKVCTTQNPACTNTPPVIVTVNSPKSTLTKAVRNVTASGTFATSANAAPGDVIEYQLTYTNTGPGTATSVTISDPIPSRSTYQSCSQTPACTTTGTNPVTSVSWSIGTVAANQTVVVTFRVTLDSSFPAGTTDVKNVGSATTAEETGTTNSNETVVHVTAQPNLTLGKSANAGSTVINGTAITYTLTYSNSGKAPAVNTVITEVVPAGTTFSSCSNSCSVNGTTVTWAVGTVNPGFVGSVTLTVTVNSTAGCTICNTATIASPSQNSGTAVSSNQVCAVSQPADNPAGAHANGSAQGAAVTADLPLIGVINQHLATTSSTQSGVGQDAHQNQLDLGPLNPLLIPTDGSLLRADLLRVTSTSTVTATPAKASDQSTAETLGVRVLGNLVTADVVEGVATANADGGSSSYSSAGSTFKNLRVQGIAQNNVAPNTTIALGDILGIGLDVKVSLREEVATTSGPSGLSGGTYAAGLTVNMIHVHVGDGNILKGGKQPIDVIVSQAVAHADFPQTRVCDALPTRSVSGHAFVAGATVVDPTGLAFDPNVLTASVVAAEIPARGGQMDIQTDHAQLPDDGSVVDAVAAEAFSTGGFDATKSSSYDFASAANVCVELGAVAGCDITATAVRSVSYSSANALGRSSFDNYNGDTTQLVGLSIMGTSLADILATLGLPNIGQPPPNTVIAIPGIATIVLNEQFCDNGALLANHCADAVNGHAGLTVRAIHVILLDAVSPPLADIVVAEAHSDATWK